MDSCTCSTVGRFLSKYPDPRGSLISILQDIQSEFKYLPEPILRTLAQESGIRLAKILGVATFYAQFRLDPVGANMVLLCQGTACHVNGSKRIEAAIKENLGLAGGAETTEDKMFTVSNVACLGCCSLSPVMMINDETYGALSPKSVGKILDEYRKGDTAIEDSDRSR